MSEEDPTTSTRTHITGPLDGQGNRLEPGAPLYVLPDDNGFNKHKTADFDALVIGPND